MHALMLIDLQRGMCDQDGPAGSTGLADQVRSRGVLGAAGRALQAARAAGIPAVHVRLAFEPDYSNRTNRTERFDQHELARRFLVGSIESEIRAEVEPLGSEIVVNKGSVSPFASTALLTDFERAGIRYLHLAGVATHLAIESAAREAADRGFVVSILEDACASPNGSMHEHSIGVALPGFARISSTDDFIANAGAIAAPVSEVDGNPIGDVGGE